MKQDKTREEEIEIQEPPIKELVNSNKKRKGCFSFGCSLGCLMSILILALILVIIFFISTGTSKSKTIPENFPSTVPIYNPSRIDSIYYISAKKKNTIMQTVSLIPKLVLFPVARATDWRVKHKLQEIIPQGEFTAKENAGADFINFIKTPVGIQTNVVVFEWNRLAADKDFIMNFYKDKLSSEDYNLSSIEFKEKRSVLRFASQKSRGSLVAIESTVEEYKIEKLILALEYEN